MIAERILGAGNRIAASFDAALGTVAAILGDDRDVGLNISVSFPSSIVGCAKAVSNGWPSTPLNATFSHDSLSYLP
jgi:hypothetical protein